MRVVLIFLIATIMFSCGTSDKTLKKELPLFYKTGEHIKYPKSTYISAHGEGKTIESAIQNAKYNVSQKISSTISGTFVSEKKSFLENSKWKNKQKLSSTVVMSTEFKNAEIIETIDTTKNNNKHYAFVVISKERGFSYVKPKLDEAKKRFNEYKNLLEKALENQNKDDFDSLYPQWVESASIYADVLAESRVYSPAVVNFENPFETVADVEAKLLNMVHNRLWLIHVVNSSGDEDKTVSEMIYSILKEHNFKVQYLSSYIDTPKTRILFKDLKNFYSNLPEEPIIIISAELIQKCNLDCGVTTTLSFENILKMKDEISEKSKKCDRTIMFYCKSAVKISSFIPNPQKQLLDLTSGDLDKTSTKKGDPSPDKTSLESSKMVKRFLEKDLGDFLKNYK